MPPDVPIAGSGAAPSRRSLIAGGAALLAGALVPLTDRRPRAGGALPDPMIGVAPAGLGTDRDAALPRFLRATRTDVDAVLAFQQLYQGDLPQEQLDAATAGRSRILTVEPFTSRDRRTSDLAGIIAGRSDWRLRAWAVAWSGRGAVRFAHEMNGDWYPWGRSIGAAEYLRLWRRARAVWRSAERDHGLPHAPWIWCINVRSAPFAPFYPGDDQCELVAVDGYAHRANGFAPATELFSDAVHGLTRLSDKRILIGETGVAVDAPDRAGWISDLLDFLRSVPAIQGMTWYERRLVGGPDYLLEGDDPSIAAFRDGAMRWRAAARGVLGA